MINIINNAIAFLQQTQLQAKEITAYNQVIELLEKIASGDLIIVEKK